MTEPTIALWSMGKDAGSRIREFQKILVGFALLILLLSVQEYAVLNNTDVSTVSQSPVFRSSIPLHEVDIPERLFSNTTELTDLEQVLQRYFEWHSVRALRNDYSNPNRKYALAVLSCPMEAGNRYHQFLNSLIHSVITNRTVLYKYLDQDYCIDHVERHVQERKSYKPLVCSNVHLEAQCLGMIDLPRWIPRWDDWSDQLGLDLSDVKQLDFWNVYNYHESPQWVKVWAPVVQPIDSIIPPDAIPDRLVEFPVMVSRYMLHTPAAQHQIYATKFAKSTWPRLWSRGSAYLYGFLLYHLVPLRSEHRIIPPILEPNSLSIALHSRHTISSYTGQDIDKEKACIKELLNNAPDRPCHVCLMSDRSRTIEGLKRWLANETLCTSFSVQHDNLKKDQSVRDEHGPNAGMGFLQELDVCSHSNAYIGNTNGPTSSLLLESLVTYRTGGPVPSCRIQRKNPWDL